MFTYHTKETAPEESKPLIDQSIQFFGFLPNLSKIMAEAPISYEVFNTAYRLFPGKSAFSPVEEQVIMINCCYTRENTDLPVNNLYAVLKTSYDIGASAMIFDRLGRNPKNCIDWSMSGFDSSGAVSLV